MLVKADIKEAYRMVPVNPDDQFLLAVEWANRIYIDNKHLPLASGQPQKSSPQW